jgi:hypothetical protein
MALLMAVLLLTLSPAAIAQDATQPVEPPTPIPSDTPLPPSETPLPPTNTDTPILPSPTPVPPTDTETPLPPTYTDTPLPPTDTATESPSPTFTDTASAVPTPSMTATASATATSTVTGTGTDTPTGTYTPTATITETLGSSVELTEELTVTPDDDFSLLYSDDFSQNSRGWATDFTHFVTQDTNNTFLHMPLYSPPLEFGAGGLDNFVVQLRFVVIAGGMQVRFNQTMTNAYVLSVQVNGQVILERDDVILGSAVINADLVNQWHVLNISSQNGEITISVDQQTITSAFDTSPLPPGILSILGYPPEQSDFSIDDFSLSIPSTDIEILPTPLADSITSIAVQPQGMPQSIPNPGRILFRSGGNSAYFTMNSDGSDIQPLATLNGATLSRWSSDGLWFVMRDGPTNGPRSNLDIIKLRFDGLAGQFLTLDPFGQSWVDTDPAWSPNGEQIVYASHRGGAYYNLYIMNSDGSNNHLLIENGVNPTWSPNGGQIIFSSARSGYHNIYSVNVDGTNLQQLTTTPQYAYAMFPDWSPNSSQIAYALTMMTAPGNYIYSTIVRMSANGSSPYALYTSALGAEYPSWSLDGTMLSFSSMRGIGFALVDIYVMNSDGTNVRNLTMNFSGASLNGVMSDSDWGRIPTSFPTLTPFFTPTFTPTPLPSAPTDTNLIANGTFASGLTSWTTWNATANATGTMLNITRNSGTSDGGFYQSVSQSIPANAPLELTLQMGNSSTVPKRINLILRDGGWRESFSCSFTIPALSALQSYTMQVRTTRVWSPLMMQGWLLEADGIMAVQVDNVNLQYKSNSTITGTNCLSNVLNGDFNAGLANWQFQAINRLIVNGALQVSQTSTADGVFWQVVNTSASPSSRFELTMQLGNTSAAAKAFTMVLRGPTWTDAKICYFSLPASTPLQTYTLQILTPSVTWSQMYVQGYLTGSNTSATVLVDNITLLYKPNLTTTNCIPANQTPTPTPTPTPTATPISNCAGGNAELIPQYLYQQQGLTQEMIDMRAGGSSLGLYVHDAPILNARRIAGPIAWDSPITVTSRIAFGTEPFRQIWYQINLSGTIGWIIARIDGINYVDANDPCTSLAAPANITFNYNRQAVRDYAVVHSYQNNGSQPPANRVTRRLGFYAVPFANFYYPDLAGSSESTGSAMFVSESVWMGGMPMTYGAPDSCSANPYVNPGWRYCWTLPQGSSTAWEAHEALGEYYTTALLPPTSGSSSNILNPHGSQVMFPGPLLTQYTNRLNFEDVNDFIGPVAEGGMNTPIRAADFSTFARNYLGPVRAGDYMWIDSYNASQGGSYHGLVIVGWNTPVDCNTAMNTIYTTISFSIAATDVPTSTPIVPWVADFTDPSVTQSMVPRPFYCTRFTQDGSPSSFFIPHDWYFYTFPNSVTIPNSQLFVDPLWQWQSSDG